MSMSKDKKYHPTKSIRVPQHILDQIETENFSGWVLDAIKSKLESEKGLTPAYDKKLSVLLSELIAIGRNVNQLARAANMGKPVSVDSTELMEKISALKTEVLSVKKKLN